ncbi:hypothetical protein BC1002_4142 [Paraburkholderia atlantica]|uniref:Uncharacterized protein n=1 Tax=Paraburkholderia atlantica TaxID=2654982 RepID=D5WI44_PARAM|nr:hypothetical protein [Paraburkholderia atlantica]ADG18139.1 hypothetical protein BC1002_4142 [Paraburkholderia atlantica]
MKTNSWPTLIAVAIVTAVQSMAASSRPEMVTVRLTATPANAGKIGQAVLVEQGSGTAMSLLVGGVPKFTALPAHIYTFIYPGSCGNLGAKPAYALNQRVVLGDSVPTRVMRMWKFIPASMSDLTSSDYAVVLRTSAADGNVDVFCGNLNHTS